MKYCPMCRKPETEHTEEQRYRHRHHIRYLTRFWIRGFITGASASTIILAIIWMIVK